VAVRRAGVMGLVADWRHAWRFASVLGAVLLAVLNYAAEHSAELALVLPENVMHQVNVWAPLALIVLRLMRQNIPARDCAPAPAAPVTPKESP